MRQRHLKPASTAQFDNVSVFQQRDRFCSNISQFRTELTKDRSVMLMVLGMFLKFNLGSVLHAALSKIFFINKNLFILKIILGNFVGFQIPCCGLVTYFLRDLMHDQSCKESSSEAPAMAGLRMICVAPFLRGNLSEKDSFIFSGRVRLCGGRSRR